MHATQNCNKPAERGTKRRNSKNNEYVSERKKTRKLRKVVFLEEVTANIALSSFSQIVVIFLKCCFVLIGPVLNI